VGRRAAGGAAVLTLDLARGRERLAVLALGAHSDDIEIGCGGTILRLAREIPRLELTWVVLSAQGGRADEARAGAEAFGATTVEVEDFDDAFFKYGREVKEHFEALKQRVSPDVVLTHYGSDLHQDHRLVSELTWNTFRDHLILEYEIPKYDGDLGAPNVFVHLDEELCARKVETLQRCFPSQAEKPWFGEDLFRALLRLRGMESRAPSGLAEAFYGRKLVV
jgi:LmbE family N-acetylglucosaminyl deacetylase